jgi:hypothetical protein
MVSDVLERPQDPKGLSAAATASGKLQRIVLAKLKDKKSRGEIPTSIRFLFYELEQEGVISKRFIRQDGKEGKRKSSQNLTDAVTHLREVGLVPWDWIADDSRTVHDWYFAPTVREYLADEVERARIDPWVGGLRPVVLTESRAVGGVFARGIAADYLVAVAPTGGQSAGFLVTQVAPLFKDEATCVLYVGDYDLAGNQIEANTRDVLERHAGREIPWERVALTEAQTEELRARGVEPIAKKDNRYKGGRPHLAFEAEAIGQAEITGLLRGHLDQLLPEPLADVLERQRREKEEARRLLQSNTGDAAR